MSERLIVILIYLQDHEIVTSEELASLVDVSSRTIKSDIEKLNEIIMNNGACVSSKRGRGYYLEINNKSLFSEYMLCLKNEERKLMNIPRTSKERSLYIIRKLLMIDFPVKIEELADEIFVSRQTLQENLKDVKVLLENYNLNLYSGKAGICIDGDEVLRRRCICDLFFLRNSEFYVQDNELFSSTMNQEEIRFIREALLNVLNKYKLRFSDLSIQNMVIHIMIAIRRYRFYQYVSFNDEKKKEIKNTEYYAAAMSLKDMIEGQFSVILPEDEVIYLAMHIKSKVIIIRSDVSNVILNDMDELLYNIYRRVNRRFNISLFLNQNLSELLKLHIPAMVDRIQNNLSMRNPLCVETIRRYQFAVEICLEVVDEIEKEFDIKIDKNEFAYLVLYFNLALSKAKQKNKQRIVLVCGRGRPETIQIMNQLEEKFDSLIDKIVTIDIYDLDTFTFYNQDILISTVPINQEIQVPCIYVRGYIEDYYDEIYRTLLMGNFVNVDIKKILKKSDCLMDCDCETKDDVLKLLQTTLSSEIGNGVASEIISNICIDFSEIGNHCAILHSLMDCPVPTIVMMKLKHPILWMSKYVQDIYFISVNANGTVVMEYVYNKISNLYETEYTDIQKFEQLKKILK